jgi:hypothetical protein
MMQSLTLSGQWNDEIGGIHCPELRTLTIRNINEAVDSIIPKPMPNVHSLDFSPGCGTSITLYLKLFDALPDLVSLRCFIPFSDETVPQTPDELLLTRAVLQSLKSFPLTPAAGDADLVIRFLTCLDVPSLNCLDLPWFPGRGGLDQTLLAICGHGTVQLRCLISRRYSMTGTNIYAMLKHLNHLETLILNNDDYDELLIALSPHNRDFSSACPRLKMAEINISPSTFTRRGPLADCVQRRVMSDLDDPAPGLVTCLKLSLSRWGAYGGLEQLGKTHSKSFHIM